MMQTIQIQEMQVTSLFLETLPPGASNNINPTPWIEGDIGTDVFKVRHRNQIVAKQVAYCPDANTPCTVAKASLVPISSRTLKKNIKKERDYEKALKLILKIPLFSYEFKKDHPDKRRMGVISEELPEELQIKADPPYPDLPTLRGYLIASVKLLYEKLTEIKTQINESLNKLKEEFIEMKEQFQKRISANEKALNENNKKLNANEKTLNESNKRISANEKSVNENNKRLSASEKTLNENNKRFSSSDCSDALTVMKLFKKWIGDYNNVAPHSGLGMKSPLEYRKINKPSCLVEMGIRT